MTTDKETAMPHYSDDTLDLHVGDCLDIMRTLPDNSVDSIVTDPPYGLGFMGKAWDDLPPGVEWATECLRVLKPGGHLLAFGGSRTWHRLAAAVEDAGFEIRDSIAWLYGSGFPKSLDVSKAIDKAAGAEREVTRIALAADDVRPVHVDFDPRSSSDRERRDTPATDEARTWQGWGTALKPAFEPIVVGRKPLAGTVAANVLQHGVGALNIDACRIATTDKLGGGQTGGSVKFAHEGWNRPWMDDPEHVARVAADARAAVAKAESLGRWPTNVVLDDDQAAELDQQTGTLKSGANPTRRNSDKFREAYGDFKGQEMCTPARGADAGGASRFFPTFRYQAKAPAKERPKVDGVAHPTVKPLDLMRWLVRLVTPPGGTILEPFLGSGTTVEAARIEGFRCIGIERDESYLPLIEARLGITREALDDVPPWLREAA